MIEREQVAEIGVIGGSGFYSLLEDAVERWVNTPYGHPTDTISIGEIGGRRVAFVPRHGRGHRHPAHRVNYRANVWAMWSLGVTRILAPSAAGSLQPHVCPGHFVVCDQFVDRTNGRDDTYFDGPVSAHISSADPYCPDLRSLAVTSGRSLDIPMHDRGTVVVIQGPRFSTRAESRWFSSMGWEVINMTQYPEVVLARELELCYVNISLITDWDVGLDDAPGVAPVSAEEVLHVFNENNERVKDLIYRLIPVIPAERTCPCATALAGAIIS
ncbi:MAG: S-methyl-5'-thioadenosine phosphorylase [Chloroflexi bacterium]|nr:S-methyl-5'-thioadenosine phosphorylase [Chloroflexota bacterium]